MNDLAIISPGPRHRPLKEFYSRKEAAQYLTEKGHPIEAKTLANLAQNNNVGKGPSFERIGWGKVRYARTDLDAWAAKRTVRVA